MPTCTTARLYSGDALLIEACGRTDFQNGDATALYHSVRGKLFTLDDDTLVYPAHDYEQRRISTIGQEKARNPRLGGDRTLDDFVKLMGELKLAYPKFIDHAVARQPRLRRLPAWCAGAFAAVLRADCREPPRLNDAPTALVTCYGGKSLGCLRLANPATSNLTVAGSRQCS